jgi:hypothetical protein
MRFSTALLVGVVMVAAPLPARADVQLAFEGGQVSVRASNATIRDILAEWARVGQTKIVNAERIPGGPFSLELTGVTEEEALEIILRSVAGYVAAPRLSIATTGSRYDRIIVMPTSTPTKPAPTQPTFAQPGMPQPPQQFPGQFPPQFPPQFPQPRPVDDDVDDGDEPAPNVVMPNPGVPNPGMFNQPPPGPGFQPQQPPGVGQRPGASGMPVGSSVPGMVVPAPQQPNGRPGAPGAPNRPDDP